MSATEIDDELSLVSGEAARAQEKIDRSTYPIEAGALVANTFGANVQALGDQLGQLEATRVDPEA